LRLVVVSELPKTRSTLLLRLLGAGRTFRDALQELERLPADAWEVRTSLPLLIRYQLEIKSLPVTERTAEEEAIMAAHELYEKWERERVERGKALGLEEGLAQGLALLVAQFEHRLGRKISSAERQRIRERLDTLGPERLGRVVLDLGAEELADWLADPKAG
jgi:flagellar biosynthesis/type III secretory pathway protein FliH